jgi:magnesium transporter
VLSTTLAVACFAKLMLIDNLIFGYEYTWQVSAVVSLALLLTIMIAKTVGCLMPILAKLCRLDPAVVASPFITTIVDVLSLIVYCGIAGQLLS